MELQKMHKCDHCGAIAGKKRPIGQYKVELFGFEYHNEYKLLCITCLKHYRRLSIEEEMVKENAEKSPGFFEGLMAFTKKHIHHHSENVTP